MSEFDENLQLPPEFDGIVRLFPLPEFVLFPGVGQMLNIFEPRYLEMTRDALDGDRLIAMGQLYSDRVDKFGNPEISQTVCLGRILTEVELEDGRYHLFLVGVCRARILEELETDEPYRMARVEILTNEEDESSFVEVRQRILSRFFGLESLGQVMDEQTLDKFRDESISLGRLVDMIAYAVGLDAEQRQLILDCHNLSERLALIEEMLIGFEDYLRRKQSRPRDFPPKFSAN